MAAGKTNRRHSKTSLMEFTQGLSERPAVLVAPLEVPPDPDREGPEALSLRLRSWDLSMENNQGPSFSFCRTFEVSETIARPEDGNSRGSY